MHVWVIGYLQRSLSNKIDKQVAQLITKRHDSLQHAFEIHWRNRRKCWSLNLIINKALYDRMSYRQDSIPGMYPGVHECHKRTPKVGKHCFVPDNLSRCTRFCLSYTKFHWVAGYVPLSGVHKVIFRVKPSLDMLYMKPESLKSPEENFQLCCSFLPSAIKHVVRKMSNEPKTDGQILKYGTRC